MLEEKIKQIIAIYTKLPVALINPQTLIDRSVITNSILVHRMYASLAAEGFVVDNYWGIQTYGALLQRLSANGESTSRVVNEPAPVQWDDLKSENELNSIGIDIAEISLMPQVVDFRADDFYIANFSSSEIAYCILQADPLASFAGLFAAKEAIVKADNSFINTPFNTIIIDHLPHGKPVSPGFKISISHTSTIAIGIAIKAPAYPISQNTYPGIATLSGTGSSNFFLYMPGILALIISLIALILHFS